MDSSGTAEGLDATAGRDGGTAARPSRAVLSGPGARQAADAAVLLVAVVAAYHYTLSTLLSGLTLDSPLAYLGLVPFVALGLAVVILRRPHHEHDIHDRQVDLSVGLPLLVAGLAVALVLPDRLESSFWLWRVDVLSLPLFLAGAVAVLFGVRVMWRLRLAFAFLLLAWPLPWVALLGLSEQGLLASTTGAVRAVLAVAPIARPTGDPERGLFEVLHPTDSFVVTIASTCAGANATVGFLLFGTAVMLLARGSRRRKLAWIAAGTILAWAINVLRIVGLLGAGWRWGESVAIDALHPVLGALLFGVVSLVMWALLPRFGLSFGTMPEVRRTPSIIPGAAGRSHAHRAAVVMVLVAATLLAGSANSELRTNDRIIGPFGEPRLAAFSAAPAKLRGWNIGDAGQYQQAARYFGPDATWRRLLYMGSKPSQTSGLSAMPVSVDAIGTGSRRALSAFSVAACYSFHRFDIRSQSVIALGGGVQGELFTYYNRRDERHWSTLSWEWPVQDRTGTRYERVVMVLVDVTGAPVPQLDGKPVPGSEHAPLDVRLAAERAFLSDFAQRMVQDLLSSPEPTVRA